MTTDVTLNLTLDKYLAEARPTLVEFFNEGCERCAKMKPIMTEVRAHTGTKANVLSVDCASSEDLVEKYHIRTCPTYLLFKDGQEVWRDSGAKPMSELLDMLHRFE